MQDALDKIMRCGQTTIVVAHRLSTVRNASRIAVVAGGVIQEIGTWEDLMSRQGGLFRRMSQFQSLNGDHKININSILAQAKSESKMSPKKCLGHTPGALDDLGNKQSSGEGSSKMNNSKRARLLAKDDIRYLAAGSFGALLAGVGFPAAGVRHILNRNAIFLLCFAHLQYHFPLLGAIWVSH